MAIGWASSADKHGIASEDALHAMLNAYYHRESFDEPRVPGAARPDLYVGPPRKLGAPLLEVMAETSPPRSVVVFHVMVARQKFLDMMKEDQA